MDVLWLTMVSQHAARLNTSTNMKTICHTTEPYTVYTLFGSAHEGAGMGRLADRDTVESLHVRLNKTTVRLVEAATITTQETSGHRDGVMDLLIAVRRRIIQATSREAATGQPAGSKVIRQEGVTRSLVPFSLNYRRLADTSSASKRRLRSYYQYLVTLLGIQMHHIRSQYLGRIQHTTFF
ncbi:hypothetical protein GWK47_037169 [Chionoecetes opilio]|uniref:Uncharacterized protein n=1 Tax=Chionoecetes opilio TaxID=41210 RepID=A0A8J5CMQ6_CHIOP|nr:hypothetical protein GWK47_037169 [Chionoecetes opilio]